MTTPFSGSGYTYTLLNNVYTITFIGNGNITFNISNSAIFQYLIVGGGGQGSYNAGGPIAGGGGGGGQVIIGNNNIINNQQYNITYLVHND